MGLTMSLDRGGLYPLALFIPRSSWHFLSQEDFISGINYHGNVLSPDTFQHLGVLAFFIPCTFYPWKNLSPKTNGIFYPWKNLSREESIPGRIYHGKILSPRQFCTFYPTKNLASFMLRWHLQYQFHIFLPNGPLSFLATNYLIRCRGQSKL